MPAQEFRSEARQFPGRRFQLKPRRASQCLWTKRALHYARWVGSKTKL